MPSSGCERRLGWHTPIGRCGLGSNDSRSNETYPAPRPCKQTPHSRRGEKGARDRPQVRRIWEMRRTCRSPFQRAMTTQAPASGSPLPPSASPWPCRFRCHEWTTITDRMARRGGRQGQPPTLTPAQQEALKARAAEGAFRTIYDAVEWVRETFGVAYTYWEMWSWFERQQIERNVSRSQAVQADPAQQEGGKKETRSRLLAGTESCGVAFQEIRRRVEG